MATFFERFRRLGRGVGAPMAICACWTLAGCAEQLQTHGDKIEADRLAQLQPNVQKKDNVTDLLGSPSSIAVFDDETWYYISSLIETRSIFDQKVKERQVVALHFDKDGVLSTVDIFGQERGREIEVVDRETPSFGESVNFLQQVFGNLGRFNSNGESSDRGGGGAPQPGGGLPGP